MKKIKTITVILIITIIVSIFFIPQLITIYKTKNKLNKCKLEKNNFIKKESFYLQKLNEIKNYSKILQESKDEEISKMKELIKYNMYYGQEIEEGKSDYYLIERRNDFMKGLIKTYEKNNISSYKTINNLKNFFINNTLDSYYNNISNILLLSNIIKTESDIEFIYNKIISQFYSVNKNNFKKYILMAPCFKSSFDTNDPFIFHKKCNKYKETMMLIKTNKTRFGGITDLSWGKDYHQEIEYNNTRTRLFNLDNQKIFNYNNNQKVSRHIPPIRGDNYYFAIFGYNDIYLGYLPWESSSNFPQMFLKDNKTNKRFNDVMNEEINPFFDEVRFEYEEIEVYPITFK